MFLRGGGLFDGGGGGDSNPSLQQWRGGFSPGFGYPELICCIIIDLSTDLWSNNILQRVLSIFYLQHLGLE